MTTDIPAGYKLTEVGVIPGDWSVSTVGHEFEIKLGKMIDAEKNIGEPKPYIGNRAVQWGRIDVNELPMVPMTRADIEQFRLRKGDLLVCEGGEVGRAAIWKSPVEECYFQKALHRLRPLHGFDSRIMAALLGQWSERGQLVNYVTQTSIAHLPREKFLEMPIAVPPPAEQRAIATALSDVDALLAKLDALIAKKRDLKQATMQQLLTGQTRLPGFSGGWAYKRLKEVALLSPGINKPISEMGSGVLYVTVQDLYDGNSICVHKLGRIEVSESELETHELAAGDIIFGKSSVKREGIGYPSIFLGAIESAVTTGFSYRARAFKELADPKFLFYALRWGPTRKWLIDNSQASALTNINKSIADSIPIPLPPLDEQTAIATVLSDMDTELAALQTRRDKTHALKQGMMQALLTGRIRLVPTTPHP